MSKKKPIQRTRTALPVTTLATLLAASGAQAAVQVINTPIDVSGSVGNVALDWNIDGIGVAEAQLTREVSTSSSAGYGYFDNLSANMAFARPGSLLDDLSPISPTGSVGGTQTNYSFNDNSVFFSNDNGIERPRKFTSIPNTDGLIGFRFDSSGETHYGVASITWGITGTTGITLRINKWAWNDTPDTATPASALVPEPGTAGLIGLGALALGAAGLRRRRRA